MIEAGAPTIKLRVVSLEPAADRVLEVRLEPVDGDQLPSWTPGSHVDVFLDAGLTRQYSLCSSPRDASWRLGVLLEETSRGGSHHVHHRLSVGDVLEVSQPRNNFPLVLAERPVVFVAGGIGITPLLPMVHAAADAGAEWRMLCLARSAGTSAFTDELVRYGTRVVRHLDDISGMIDLPEALDRMGADRSDVYACGPSGMLDAVEAYAASRPDCTLHVERFANDEPAVREDDQPFVVELADGAEVPVAADQTILQALSQAGIRTLSSCQEGVCGTCETPVIAGFPDHRDHVLSEEERAAGDVMMPCVSRCLGERLVLDL